MPIFSYKSDDGDILEYICSHSERPATITTNDKTYTYSISASLPARHSSWTTLPYGVNGKWDGNLGKRVYTHGEMHREYDKQGLTPIGAHNIHILDDKFTKIENERKEADKKNKKVMDILSIPDTDYRERRWNEEFAEEELEYADKHHHDIDKRMPELFDGSLPPLSRE